MSSTPGMVKRSKPRVPNGGELKSQGASLVYWREDENGRWTRQN